MGNSLDAPPPKDEDDNPAVDNGYRMVPDQGCRVIPTQRDCFYCCEEGKTLPIELFAMYPCCGYQLCLDCMNTRIANDHSCCGECMTNLPRNGHALLWLEENFDSVYGHKDIKMHLLERVHVRGCHTYLDELMRMPLYQRLPQPGMLLAFMNPPDVDKGVQYLTMAAENGLIAAMLDLADAYNTDFLNDPFPKNDEKAEYWYRRALGERNSIFPLAFTRYGEFLRWKNRNTEAKQMFSIAAQYGHAKAQYEYAQCLLKGLGKEDEKLMDAQTSTSSNTNTTTRVTQDEISEAIEWLCKACQKGFYVPSYILLANTLIDITEKAYGTVHHVGRNPLPRVLQILSHAQAYNGYGSSKKVEETVQDLCERFHSVKEQCENCGVTGSENNPLVPCARCGISHYCSKICLRRAFRDGHKFDCCSQKQIFDFSCIKGTLPWIRDLQRKGVHPTPALPVYSEERRTLIQMVEDDTDEIYGEDVLDYDEHILVQLMLRMRMNVETYLNRMMPTEEQTQKIATGSSDKATTDKLYMNLKQRIDAFAIQEAQHDEIADFVKAMHTIREYGNQAAHRTPQESIMDQHECEEAVRKYRLCKEKFSISKCRIQSSPASEVAPVATLCVETSTLTKKKTLSSKADAQIQVKRKKRKDKKKKN